MRAAPLCRSVVTPCTSSLLSCNGCLILAEVVGSYHHVAERKFYFFLEMGNEASLPASPTVHSKRAHEPPEAGDGGCLPRSVAQRLD